MGEFTGRLLAMGSVTGQRKFGIDRLGRLTSYYRGIPFKPGVNEAECLASEYGSLTSWSVMIGTGQISVDPYKIAGIDPPEKPRLKPHDVGAVGCTCGYYAYLHDEHDWDQYTSGIYGIIEGWGVCSVGDRGFRASRAQLVAIVKPKWVPNSWWDRVVHNYPKVPVYEKKKDARAAHPLSMPTIPTPESCDDFWTRSA
jgi:hypothetical protein